jgi:uncharacterized protein
VGTDLVWGVLTKAVGAAVHHQQKTVDFTIVKRLAIGSVPGALAGLALLARFHKRSGPAAMDQIVVRLLAIALMCVAVSLFVRAVRRQRTNRAETVARGKDRPWWITSVVGCVVGFLVSLTSVGSGSLIVACLVIVYPSVSMRRIVGSDIVHALILLSVSAAGHLSLGNINVSLLGVLLVGSIPGVWVGSKMTAFVPERVLQPILATTLFFLGYKLL